jgi:ribosomal protein L4
MTETENETIPLDRLAKIYRKIRTEITTLTQEYDSKVETLKAQQEEIKNAMKDMMKTMGVTSVRTAQGTVVLSIKTRYNTQDWDSFKKFVVEHDAVDLLEKRIAQTNMSQFLEENPGLVPPGLNSHAEYDISVRKPTN